ncbi:MAG: type II secretion system protein [Burkholderiaceae bacterium]
MTPSAKLHLRRRRFDPGFTMIELVVVMAVLGLLLSIALPRYIDSLARGREHVLVHNLAQLREAIDRHYGDRGAYPDRLEDLVERRYLRAVPLNPFTDAADWQLIGPPAGAKGAVFDVAEPASSRASRERGAEPEAVSASAAAESRAP